MAGTAVVFTGATGRNTDKMFSETEAEIFAKRAIELGVPESAILKETRSTNTGENILYTYELLKAKNIESKSIILVTKPYMLRRAYATFMKQWPSEPKPDIICSALNVSFKDYCNDKTCLFELTANIMVSDLERIIKYPKLGYQIEQKVPDEVMTAYYRADQAWLQKINKIVDYTKLIKSLKAHYLLDTFVHSTRLNAKLCYKKLMKELLEPI